MEMRPRLVATCLLGISFLLLVTSSDGHTGLGKGFGDHIHWRTLEDGKKEAAARAGDVGNPEVARAPLRTAARGEDAARGGLWAAGQRQEPACGRAAPGPGRRRPHAAVERRLSRQDVVILDSLNYIKGFRYELYCLARAARTPLCLVYCVRPRGPSRASPAAGAQGNPGRNASASWRPRTQERGGTPEVGARVLSKPQVEGSVVNGRARDLEPEETGTPDSPVVTPESENSAKQVSSAFYPPELLEALTLRFEAPDSRNRWDRPLFTLVGLEEPLPLAEIRAALFENRPPPPHQSTQSQPLASGNFLHQLDQVTSQVLTGLMDAQKSAVPGDLITLPGTTEHLRFTRPLTMAELSRLRRQFISYTKMHPNNENLPQLANMFLQYLSQSLH
ncbi:Protein KTI12 like protein [Tupaia chinensis]|uniref:Protein KTI12 homolog n=1 Tax=Tupaia chinensis TaxID=246437 RepID=L9KSK3_TUPCH|nr:Protein KTI12 like protein [Tupaia chinensis]